MENTVSSETQILGPTSSLLNQKVQVAAREPVCRATPVGDSDGQAAHKVKV